MSVGKSFVEHSYELIFTFVFFIRKFKFWIQVREIMALEVGRMIPMQMPTGKIGKVIFIFICILLFSLPYIIIILNLNYN